MIHDKTRSAQHIDRMPTADLVLLGILAVFALYGWWFGVVHALGTLVGVAIGSFGAGRLFGVVALRFLPLFGGNLNLARIVTFFVLFVLINRFFSLRRLSVRWRLRLSSRIRSIIC